MRQIKYLLNIDFHFSPSLRRTRGILSAAFLSAMLFGPHHPAIRIGEVAVFAAMMVWPRVGRLWLGCMAYSAALLVHVAYLILLTFVYFSFMTPLGWVYRVAVKGESAEWKSRAREIGSFERPY